MRTIVLGPPGTGKTTTLLNKVDDYLKKTDPNKIGYFAFTKKAANEAKDRAMRDFNLGEDDLPYFRTLHSLAFRKLGLKKDQVMQPRHYKDLGKKLGFPVTYADYQEDQGGIFTSDSDYLKQTDPDKIGYFAFTKKAANEARDRAIKKFNLTEDDLPYFRTLHSLAFRKLGLKKIGRAHV